MKTRSLLTAMLVILAATRPAAAQNEMAPPETVVMTAPETAVEAPVADPVMEKVTYLQNAWADIKYGGAAKDRKLADLQALEAEAAALAAANPARAEPMIWDAIILSTEAGVIKGVSALPKVKKAKALLEAALRIDAAALDGSAHTSLGSLYYQVPGWPIGFGDSKKAEQHLQAALVINPDGIDPNFFYGDFLLKQERYQEAVEVLHRAQAAPAREGRATADAGRQAEIAAALADAEKGLAKHRKPDFN